MSRRIQLLVSYRGASFLGFARSWSAPVSYPPLHDKWSVQGALEAALDQFLGASQSGVLPAIVGSSRTDSGVNADANSCHFDLPARPDRHVELNSIVRGMNNKLNCLTSWMRASVAVVGAYERPLDWHCRYNAVGRIYRYQLAIGGLQSDLPLGESQWWFHRAPHWHINRMKEAAQLLVGNQDFSAFQSTGCQSPSALRDMQSVTITEIPPPIWTSALGDKQPRFFFLHFQANAFLYHQVRNMVGALVDVGRGKVSVEKFNSMLQSRSRTATTDIPHTLAPAHGLSLQRVIYPDEALS